MNTATDVSFDGNWEFPCPFGTPEPEIVIKKEEVEPKKELLDAFGSLPAVEVAPMPKKRKTSSPSYLFADDSIKNFKHVLYNLLVRKKKKRTTTYFFQACEHFEGKKSFVSQTIIKHQGKNRCGFVLDPDMQPENRLAELYASKIRNVDLLQEDKASPLIVDIYKFYARAAVELLGKYFIKVRV